MIVSYIFSASFLHENCVKLTCAFFRKKSNILHKMLHIPNISLTQYFFISLYNTFIMPINIFYG